MLLVDHDMGLVLGICDYVVVLEFGQVIAHGHPTSCARDPTVIEAYLGAAQAPRSNRRSGMSADDGRDCSRSRV